MLYKENDVLFNAICNNLFTGNLINTFIAVSRNLLSRFWRAGGTQNIKGKRSSIMKRGFVLLSVCHKYKC